MKIQTTKFNFEAAQMPHVWFFYLVLIWFLVLNLVLFDIVLDLVLSTLIASGTFYKSIQFSVHNWLHFLLHNLFDDL
jgi:hypothetical protein